MTVWVTASCMILTVASEMASCASREVRRPGNLHAAQVTCIRGHQLKAWVVPTPQTMVAPQLSTADTPGSTGVVVERYRVSGAEPKATLKRSHQITTLVSPARSASGGMGKFWFPSVALSSPRAR